MRTALLPISPTDALARQSVRRSEKRIGPPLFARAPLRRGFSFSGDSTLSLRGTAIVATKEILSSGGELDLGRLKGNPDLGRPRDGGLPRRQGARGRVHRRRRAVQPLRSARRAASRRRGRLSHGRRRTQRGGGLRRRRADRSQPRREGGPPATPGAVPAYPKRRAPVRDGLLEQRQQLTDPVPGERRLLDPRLGVEGIDVSPPGAAP